MKVIGSLECVSVCLSVSLNRWISLTAKPIWFFLIVKLLIGPGKVYKYFGGGYRHPPKEMDRTIK